MRRQCQEIAVHANEPFNRDAHVELPPMVHALGCRCALHARRRLGGALLAGGALAALPALAREGVDVEKSKFTKLVPAEQVEGAAAKQYLQLKDDARRQNALAPDNHPQLRRLRYLAQRIIPNTTAWNPRAAQWKWEVVLIGSKQINAFCMPGGKIAFYTGILEQLKLDDDEAAMIMGHEAAHALLEHAREQMGKNVATRVGAGLLSSLLGLGSTGDSLLNMGSQLLSLTYSRTDESEADLVGIELAARSGYAPGSGVTLWEKMAQASKGAPPQFLSTHPSGPTRIRDIQNNLPKVEPLFARASKPDQRWDGKPAGFGVVPQTPYMN
jgi:predicted Zn-dependent protease